MWVCIESDTLPSCYDNASVEHTKDGIVVQTNVSNYRVPITINCKDKTYYVVLKNFYGTETYEYYYTDGSLASLVCEKETR